MGYKILKGSGGGGGGDATAANQVLQIAELVNIVPKTSLGFSYNCISFSGATRTDLETDINTFYGSIAANQYILNVSVVYETLSSRFVGFITYVTKV